MVKYNLFSDILRQEEIDKFYDVSLKIQYQSFFLILYLSL